MLRVLQLTLLLASLFFSLPHEARAQGVGLFEGSGGNDPSAPSNSLAMPPLSWQKLRYEEKLLESLKKDLSVVVPADQFVVTLEVLLKEPSAAKPAAKSGPGSKKAEVFEGGDLMSKLGVDSPAPSPDEVRKKDDLFENIGSITIDLVLDTQVDKTREAIVTKLLDRVSPTIKKAKAKINVSRLDLVVAKAPIEPFKLKPIDWLKEFKDPAGRLLALTVFGFMIFLISFIGITKANKLGQSAVTAFKEYTVSQQELGQKKNESNIDVGQISNTQNGEASTHEEAPEDAAASALISSQHDKELAGIEKFKKLVAQNPQAASLFVRQWIKIKPEGSIDALIILTRSIQPENLIKLFELMSVGERKSLSKLLNSPLSKDALGRADLFLNNQIIMDLITPKTDIDPALQELLMGVTHEEIASLALDNAEAAAGVMTLLPSSQMVNIAEALPNELCEKIFPLCASMTNDQALRRMEEAKSSLLTIRGQGQPAASPFIESIPDLMANANLTKERLLYSVLASSNQWSTIDRLSHHRFPASLVEQLPADILKEVFLLLPNTRRAELVVSQAPDMQRTLLSCAGEPGKKLRDMLDLEVKELESNGELKEKLQASKEKLWMDFVETVRKVLRADPNSSKATNQVLAKWIDGLRAPQGSVDDVAQAA